MDASYCLCVLLFGKQIHEPISLQGDTFLWFYPVFLSSCSVMLSRCASRGLGKPSKKETQVCRSFSGVAKGSPIWLCSSQFLLDIFGDRGWGLYHHLIFLSSSNTTAWSLLLHLLDPGQGLCIVDPNNLIACILPTCWGDRASALLGERMSSWVRITRSQIAPLGQLTLHFGENVQGLLPITGVIVDINGMSTAPSHNRAPKGFSFALIALGVKMLCSGATFLA